MGHILWIIREPGNKFNYSKTYAKKKILSSHQQGFSRRTGCLKSANNNVKGPFTVKDITRAEFKKRFKD